jgi:2,3-bisphosphoglycerate-independent phosphoglycerate mutase
VLAALGVGFELNDTDLAARGNFCTVDDQGIVTDRRAGRIATEKNKELCKLLRQIELPGADFFVETVKDYRILLVLRAEQLPAWIYSSNAGKIPHILYLSFLMEQLS